MTTVSAHDFDQDVGAAKRAAAEGPVIITDQGEPVFVLLAIDDYRRLSGSPVDLVSWLGMDDADDVEFDASPAGLSLRIPTR